MATITIQVTSDSCKDCKYLRTTVIDHNYYGEKTIKHTCGVFDCVIHNYNKCVECTLRSTEDHDDVLKYADFLVRKINTVLEENNNDTCSN
jgi:hypothetical protein